MAIKLFYILHSQVLYLFSQVLYNQFEKRLDGHKCLLLCILGAFNNYVNKMRRIGAPKWAFLFIFRVKPVQVKVGKWSKKGNIMSKQFLNVLFAEFVSEVTQPSPVFQVCTRSNFVRCGTFENSYRIFLKRNKYFCENILQLKPFGD